MKKYLYLLAGLAILLAGLACNLTGGAAEAPTATPLAASETPTPAPSETASPTPDPAANLPRVRITTELNVRSGPSADCPIIGVMAQNIETVVYAITPERTWWQVQLGTGQTGWISAAYTTPINDVSTVPTLAGPVCEPAATHTPAPPTATGTLPPSPTYTPTTPAPSPTATTFFIGPLVTLPGPILILPTRTPTPFFIGPLVTLPGPILILPTAAP